MRQHFWGVCVKVEKEQDMLSGEEVAGTKSQKQMYQELVFLEL